MQTKILCYNLESNFDFFLPRHTVESTKLVFPFADCNEVDKGGQFMNGFFILLILVITRAICLLICLDEANELLSIKIQYLLGHVDSQVH
jgi:hypothetical protein